MRVPLRQRLRAKGTIRKRQIIVAVASLLVYLGKSTNNVKCYYCGKFGHTRQQCKKRLWDEQRNHGQSEKKQTNVGEHEEEAFYDFVASHARGKSADWFFDSGASKHMTNGSDRFVEFVENKTKSEMLLFGDRRAHFVEGHGNVQIKMRDKTLMFENVFYIPRPWIE